MCNNIYDVKNKYTKWKMIVISQDKNVHKVIQGFLYNFKFEDKTIDIIDVYSYKEAKRKIAQNLDIALVFIDSINKNDLALIKYIREELANRCIRIVINTIKEGQAFKNKELLDFETVCFREIREFTSKNMISVVISSLREYKDISIVNKNRRILKEMTVNFPEIFQIQSITQFTKKVLCQMIRIINGRSKKNLCCLNGFSAIKYPCSHKFSIVWGCGLYNDFIGLDMSEVVCNKNIVAIQQAINKKQNIYRNGRYITYFQNKNNIENIMYIEPNRNLNVFDLELIEMFYSNAFLAFENVCLNQEIEETQKEIIYTLGEILEARSEETGNHVKRVSEYSYILGKKYGLSEDDVLILQMASPIHDIGKVAIPDSILNKPGKLTKEEFETVKTHTTIGYNMLKKSNRKILKAGAIVAHEHHERYDGKGYPNGLKGKDIHPYGRITCMADVFDALGTDRVYKKAWKLDDILYYFKQERGGQFDPHLVDIFFNNVDEIIKIREKFSDKNAKVIS